MFARPIHALTFVFSLNTRQTASSGDLSSFPNGQTTGPQKVELSVAVERRSRHNRKASVGLTHRSTAGNTSEAAREVSYWLHPQRSTAIHRLSSTAAHSRVVDFDERVGQKARHWRRHGGRGKKGLSVAARAARTKSYQMSCELSNWQHLCVAGQGLKKWRRTAASDQRFLRGERRFLRGRFLPSQAPLVAALQAALTPPPTRAVSFTFVRRFELISPRSKAAARPQWALVESSESDRHSDSLASRQDRQRPNPSYGPAQRAFLPHSLHTLIAATWRALPANTTLKIEASTIAL